MTTWSTLDLVEFPGQLRQGLIEIGHKTVVGHRTRAPPPYRY